MRKTLLLLLTISLGILGTGNNELFARPGYFKADPVLSSQAANTGNSIFTANTIFSKFLKGIAVAPPTVTGCDNPILKDADAGCTANVSWNVPSSLDGALVSLYPQRSSNPGVQVIGNSGIFPIGTDTVIYRFQNVDGVTECRIVITVQDGQPPVVNCGATVNANADMGVCYATNVAFNSPTISDNCTPMASLKLTYSFVDGDGVTQTGTILPSTAMSTSFKFKNGTTAITWVVADTSANPYQGVKTDTCVQNVVVTDTESPVLLTPAANDITMSNATGACDTTWGFVSPTFSDNCFANLYWTVYAEDGTTPGYQIGEDVAVEGTGTNSNVDDFLFTVGVHYIVYTVSDSAGNSVGDMTMVTVLDNEAPIINWTGSINDFPTSNNGTGDCNASFAFNKPAAADNCDDNSNLTWDYIIYNAADTSVVSTGTDNVTATTLAKGAYILVYRVTDSKMNVSDSSMKWFAVVDDELPQFTSSLLADLFLGNESVAVCFNDTLLSSPNVLDNCGSVVLSWEVTQGNTVLGSNTGSIPTFQFPVGISTVVWTATDNSGNAIYDTVIVTVTDTTLPTIDAGMDVTLYTDASGCSAVLASHGISFADNCSVDVVDHNSKQGTFDMLSSTTGDFFGTFAAGVDSVIFTVTDVNGNVNYDTLVVTVLDTIKPKIKNFANINENTDLNVCSFTRSFNLANDFTPTDNCAIDSTVVYLDLDNDGFYNDDFFVVVDNVFPIEFAKGTSGVQIVTFDKSGNSAFDTFKVTVSDNQAPTANYPNDEVNIYFDPSACDSVLVALELTGTMVNDNCSDTTYLLANATNDMNGNGAIATDYFQLGSTTVTWTITDEDGNTSTESVIVTVSDITAPGDAPNDTISPVYADLGVCEAKVKVFAPVSLDSCGISSVKYSINGGPQVEDIIIDGPAFPVDTNYVEWFTTDNNNNTRIDTSVVIVFDSQLPIIAGANSYVISTSASSCSKDTTFSFAATDNCAVDTTFYELIHFTEVGDVDGDTITGNGTDVHFDFPTSAPSVITITAVDVHGNIATKTITVTVNDTQAPVINCPGDYTANADAALCGKVITVQGDNDEIMGATITDNCGIDAITATYGNTNIPFDPSAPHTFPVGTTSVTVYITDAAGNVTACTFNVTIVDNAGPIVSNFPTDTVIEALANECSHAFTWTEPTAVDACSGNNFTVTRSHASGTIFPYGPTVVTYTYTDASNNVTTKSFTVTIIDTQKPVINEIPSVLNVSLPANGCTATIVYDVKVQDNCDAQGVSITATYPSGTQLPVGDYVNNVTVKDFSGNQVDSSFVIKVRDNSNPVFTSVPADFVSCSSVVTYAAAEATDNCPVTIMYSTPSGSTLPEGVHTITVTATDANNNSTVKTFNVTVVLVTTANAGDDRTFCLDSTVSVSAVSAAGAGEAGMWTTTVGNGVVTNPGNASSTVSLSTAGVYQFTYTISQSTCSSSDNVTITVNAPAGVVNAGGDQTITSNIATLNATPLNGTWSKTDGSTAVIVNALSATTQVTSLQSGDNVFTWTVAPAGCAAVSDQVTITVEFSVSTAFTPNNDGENDTFEIPGLAGHPDATIEIFNRWGHSVFTSTGKEYGKGWDGTFEGDDLPVASYYYVIDFKDGSNQKKGYVSIIR